MRDKNEILHVEGAKAGSKQKQPYRAAVTSTTNQKMRITYGLSEGEIAGFNALGNFTETDMLKRIFLDGTPIMSEEGTRLLDVKVEFRSGTQDQSVISGLPSVTIENGVNVEVKLNAPVSRSFTRTETTSFDVRISVPQLWDGDAEGNSRKGTIQFRIEVSVNNGPFNVAGTFTVNEKIISGWSQTYNVPATKGSAHTIRIVRMNSEQVNEFSANKLIVDSIVEVTDVRLRYPRTALLYLEYNADQFSNIPKLEVQMFGKADILVPANYNPISRVYSTTGVGTSNGVWDGTFKRAYTDNPVWIWLDLITSKRYGTGNRITIDMVDKWELYGLSRYCDQLVPDGKGGQEPRFTCNNLYLQKSEDAFKVLKDLTAMFRSKTVWDGTKIRAVADVPRTPALAFTSSNCKDIVYSSVDTSAQHNLVNVQYYDKTNRFASKIEMRRDARNIVQRDRVVEMNFTALGCTSAGQAQRIAQYILVSELNEQNIVSFTTGLEGSIPKLNDVFYFADEYVAGRVIGGRVVSITGQSVKLDREVPLAVGTVADPNVQLILNRDDGTTAPIRITSVARDKRTVYLQFAPPASVGPELQWTLITPQVMPQMFYITDIEYNDKDKTYNISGMQYLESKYGAIDGDARIVVPPISINENSMLKAPATLSARYFVKIVQDISVCNVEVNWAQSANATKYQLEMRKDNGEWRIVGSYTSLTAELENMYTGIYEFRITAYDTLNNASQYTYSSPLNVQGKVLPPPALSVYAVQGILLGFQHNWVYPAHTEDSRGVRIRRALQDPAIVGGQNYEVVDVAYPSNSYTQNNVPSNTTAWFSAAIVDKYGAIGAYTGWVKASVNDDPDQIMDLIEGSIAITDLDEALRQDLQDTKQKVADAQSDADAAAAAAQQAKAQADTAAATAQSAIGKADAAQAAAQQAKTAADNAQATATKAATDLSKEVTDRINAVKAESDARIAAVATLQDGLSTETQQRKDAVSSLTQTVTNNKASTDASIANVQNQVTSQASTLASHASQLSSLDARTTTAETNIANVTQKADAAVAQGQSNATAITTLRSDLSGGKGKNAIIAPFSDPQVMPANILGNGRTIALVDSTMRIKGKAYDITFTAAAGTTYFGSTSTATTAQSAAASIRGGKKYMLSAYIKNVDSTKASDVYFTIYWFRRSADGSVSSGAANFINQETGNLRVTPTNAGSVVSFRALTAPADAFAATILMTGNGVYNTVGARIIVDMLMLEETIGDVDKPASMWVAGSADMQTIQNNFTTQASAISTLETNVGTINNTLTSQGQSITGLQNSVTNINQTLAQKADASAVQSLSNRVTVNENNITSNSQAITSLQNSVTSINGTLTTKADSSALVALSTRVASNEESITSQGSSLTNLQNSLSNVGVNLVALADQLKTVSMAATSGESYITWSLTDSALKPDTFYTLSFWAVRTANVKSVESFLIASNGAHHKSTYVTVGTTNLVRYSVTFKTNADAVGVTYSLRFDLNGSSDGNNATLTVQKPQLEEGQVATYWKPSTYDKADASALSTLQNTVTQQGNTLTSNSSAITSLQNSVTNINNALTSKADASAVSSIDSKVTTIDDKVTSNTANITSLNNSITNGSLNLVYNTLYNDLSNITANGNHSIAVDSATYARSKVLKVTATGAGQDGVHQILMTATVASVPSSTEPLVLSFYAKADTALSVKIQLFGGIGAQIIALTPTWTKYTITSLRKVAAHVDTTNLYMSLLAAGVAYFTNVQLERGTIATSYSAASTETGNLIAANASALSSLSSTVTQHGNALTSQGNSITSLSNSLVTTNNNVATAQNTADNAAAAAATAQQTANTKADASALSSLANTVSSQGGTISSQGNAITSLTNTLNNLSVGSTNLLSGTDLSTHPSKDGTFKNGNMISATATTAGSVDMLAIKSTVELLAGEYVVSFWAKAETAGTQFSVYFYNPNTTTSGTASNGATTTRADGQVVFALTTTMTKYFVKYKQAGNTSKKDVLFRIQPPASGTNKVWLALPKLEEGNVVTDWSPSINDVASSAALNSLGSTVTQQGNTLTSQGNAITSLNNSVNTLNNALATKADSSAIVALDSRVTATENSLATTNSSITSLQSAIQSQGDALNLDPNFREGLKFITVGELVTGNSIVAGNYGEGGGTGLRVTKANDAGTSGTNPTIRTPTSGMWLKAGRTYQATVRARKVSGTAGLLLRWHRASDNAAVAVRQVTATDTTNFVDFSLDYTPTSDVFAWFGVWMYPNAGVVDYSSIRLVDKTASVENAATASAVSSLTSRVASAEGTITSQGQAITSLQNDIVTVKGDLAQKASSSALTSLAGRVTTVEGTLSSQGQAITSLQNDITTINGALNTKASAEALQTLTNRVSTTETGISSLSSAITSLNNTLSNASASITLNASLAAKDCVFYAAGQDSNYTIKAEATGKSGRVIQLGDNNGNDVTWVHPNTFMPFDETKTYRLKARYRRVSGSGTIYVGVSQKDGQKASYIDTGNGVSSDMRSSNYLVSEQTPALGVWQEYVGYIKGRSTGAAGGAGTEAAPKTVAKLTGFITPMFIANYPSAAGTVELDYLILEDAEAIAQGNANASALTSLDARVGTAEGKITAQAGQLTTLSTTVGNHTTAIETNASSINGINAKYTVKIDNNGYIAGYGLISTMNNGIPTSAFTVNADYFSVGKVGSGTTTYRPFVVVTSANQVIDGVTYPETGVYMRQAFMSKLSVTSAHIQDLAVTNAKIANLSVDTSKIVDLAVSTLKIQDNAVTVPNGIYTADMQKWEFVVYNHPVGTLAGTRTVQEFNVQTNGGKLRIDATFNYATGLQVGQISASLDVKKAVTLVAQLVVNGTVVYEQEVYPTTLGKNGLSLEYIGAMATPVYLHPASTGTVNIKLNVSARAKFSNTSFGTHAPYDYYMTAASASIATMELKK